MKFFHLSDLHIGLKLMNRDLKEDQDYILQKITEYAKAEKPNAVVIAGDIYDKAVPSAEAVEVFDHFIKNLTEAVPDAVIMMFFPDRIYIWLDSRQEQKMNISRKLFYMIIMEK